MNLSVSTDDPLTLASFIIHSWEGVLIHAKATKTEEPLPYSARCCASHEKGRVHVR